MNEDEWLRSAWEQGLVKEDEDTQVYRERTSKSRMDEWQNKPMHGQFLRQTKDLSSLAMTSERGTQERDRRDDNGCTRPSTKSKIHSKSY